MKNGKIDIACATLAVAAGLLVGGKTLHAGDVLGSNYMNIIIERVDDDFVPLIPFYLLFDVNLEDVTGVTAVILEVDGVFVTDLENEGGPTWEAEVEYLNVPAIVAGLDGTWTLEIVGTSPSVTEFTVDIENLVDEGFWETPTILTPESGETGVANDVVFEWINPAGEATVDAILLEVSGADDSNYQEDNTVFGDMTVADTQWDPPLDLIDGQGEFAVIYLDFDDLARVSPVTVTEGSIVWGASPVAPKGYPASTPLLGFGSERIIAFTVGGTSCVGDIDGNGSVGFQDLLSLLFAWGPCDGECPADLNADGNVAFGDLLLLLFAWGPCS